MYYTAVVALSLGVLPRFPEGEGFFLPEEQGPPCFTEEALLATEGLTLLEETFFYPL